jgi:hypothetical protein
MQFGSFLSSICAFAESRIHEEILSSILGGTGWPRRMRCRRSSWLRVRSNSRLKPALLTYCEITKLFANSKMTEFVL